MFPNDTIGFDMYDRQEEPLFVDPRVKEEELKHKLEVVANLPKHKRREVDLKPALLAYRAQSNLIISINNSR